MAGLLTETLRSWAATPCEPYPCGLSMWRYACAASGREEIALPDHQTTIAMARLLKRNGGLEQYARGLLTSIGWVEVAEPERGDVGVIDIPAMGLTCGIFAGRRWAVKGNLRVLLADATPKAVWRFPKCHKPLPPSSLPPLA